MKKIIFALLVLLSLCLVVSCGSNENTQGQTNNGGETTVGTGDVEQTPGNENENGILTINPEEYYYVKVFELPKEDFRSAAVNHMRKQSSIEWICSGDFAVTETFNSWGIDLTFKKGEKYTGIPYADTKVSYDQFNSYLVNGTLTSDSTKWKDVYGVQCVSSIMNAVQQFAPNVAGWSTEIMPSYDQFQGVIVGDYTVPKGVKQTLEIINANGQEKMFAAYSQLKKGDIIITKDDINDSSHLRMLVEDPTVVTNATGKINPTRSYVKTIEQTNQFDKKRTDGVKTTWYVDHTYQFGVLYTTNYVPVTLEIYSKDKSECEIPYILLDKELTPSQVAAGSSVSYVKSNFPIRHVTFNVYDKAGTLVKHTKVYDMANTYSINLRMHAYQIVDGLANGDYTLVMTAGIAIGDTELQRVDFTINK